MGKKTALISVYDKKGVVEFAKGLEAEGYEIISTGGTSKTLKDSGVDVIEISKVTESPEILSGRVKTLHPKIFGGILARRDCKEDKKQLEDLKMKEIDIVAVTLYPFEETIAGLPQRSNTIPQEAIEKIDIGGVTLLRAAAKNHKDVLVISDPDDYVPVLEAIKSKKVDLTLRQKLAAKAFRTTGYYDAMISDYFTDEPYPEKLAIGLKKVAVLRYGENPHQKAAIYKCSESTSKKLQLLVDAKQLQGKELSYNNYLDLEGAWSAVIEYKDPACIIVKHTNPCGASEDKDILTAYKKALSCDPLSAFGGIVAFNREVDKSTAEEIVKLFTECVIAPRYSADALKVFTAKKDLRLLELPFNGPESQATSRQIKSIPGGALLQDRDTILGIDNLKVTTNRKPTDEELESLKFAWKLSKNVKSNTIILARGKQAVGVGAGQMSRIDALKIANSKMQAVKQSDIPMDKPLVLASDAFFPFRDVPDEAAKIGVKAIIQPGGSLKDDLSIAACNEAGMAMVFTGHRHFKH